MALMTCSAAVARLPRAMTSLTVSPSGDCAKAAAPLRSSTHSPTAHRPASCIRAMSGSPGISVWGGRIRDAGPECQGGVFLPGRAARHTISAPPGGHVMELSNTRAAVLVEQQYQELEVWYPYYR